MPGTKTFAGWIPISAERKPYNRQQVIVLHRNWGPEVARYIAPTGTKPAQWLDAAGSNNASVADLAGVVLAWRPLGTVSKKIKAQLEAL